MSRAGRGMSPCVVLVAATRARRVRGPLRPPGSGSSGLRRCLLQASSRVRPFRMHPVTVRPSKLERSRQPPVFRIGDASRLPARHRRATRRYFKERPSVDMPGCASSRGPRPASVRPCHRSDMFRPRGFSPPRRIAPHPGSWACCIPQPTMGFAGFRDSARRELATRRGLPHRRHTLQSLPLPRQPCPRHREPLPPCRSPTVVDATSRPCSAGESVVHGVRCRSPGPVALLGFPILEPVPCAPRRQDCWRVRRARPEGGTRLLPCTDRRTRPARPEGPESCWVVRAVAGATPRHDRTPRTGSIRCATFPRPSAPRHTRRDRIVGRRAMQRPVGVWYASPARPGGSSAPAPRGRTPTTAARTPRPSGRVRLLRSARPAAASHGRPNRVRVTSPRSRHRAPSWETPRVARLQTAPRRVPAADPPLAPRTAHPGGPRRTAIRDLLRRGGSRGRRVVVPSTTHVPEGRCVVCGYAVRCRNHRGSDRGPWEGRGHRGGLPAALAPDHPRMGGRCARRTLPGVGPSDRGRQMPPTGPSGPTHEPERGSS